MKKLLLLVVLLFALPVYAKDFAIENGTVTLLNITGTPGNIFLVPSGGNVGIGTTVMSQLLTVAGNANITGDVYATNFFGDGSQLTGIANTNVSILYGANTSNPSQVLPARVSEEGNLMFSIREGTGTGWDRASGNIYPSTLTDNVGIGTATPTFKLDVNGVINASGLLINGTAMTSGSTSLPAANITAGTFGSGLYTFPSGLNITQGGLIVAAGSVGIGTTSPGAKLDINVDVSTSTGDGLIIKNLATTDGGTTLVPNAWMKFYLNSLRNAGAIVAGRDSAYGSAAQADSNLQFYTALDDVNTERMRILSTGSVGIGTATPVQTLEVNGTLRLIPRATPTCNSASEGTLFYNITEKHFYGCNSTDWLRIDTTFI